MKQSRVEYDVFWDVMTCNLIVQRNILGPFSGPKDGLSKEVLAASILKQGNNLDIREKK